MLRITVEGDAIPAARPRFSRGRAYQPKRNVEYRQRVQSAAQAAMAGKTPLVGSICAAVKIFRRFKPTTRQFGDVDNHLKAIFDGLNQIVFQDDRQIVRCVVEKHTDKENPRAEIEIRSEADVN